MLVEITSGRDVGISTVGGKAASLIRLHNAGFNVPGGVVLTTEFFASWLTELCASEQWNAVEQLVKRRGVVSAQMRQEIAQACDAVKSLAGNLAYDQAQIDALARTDLGDGTFAVRSSSPEEDLTGSSFAGLYETVLNVAADGLQAAVRTCFESCLDERVLLYKREMAFEDLIPSIAVVVQNMVPSDSAGVAFSLNPLTNDYDEILINASFGLGEALVTGDITPDSFVIDKVTREIMDKQTGDKGGHRPSESSLTDDQALRIGETVIAIETEYGEPVDVEWAFAGDDLAVVQARPITAYIPLHPSLVTLPGEPRRLYGDGYLTDGVTMSVATTPMADDVFNHLLKRMVAWMLGIDQEKALEIDLRLGGMHMQTGRFYLDISMWMHLFGNGAMIAAKADEMNPMMAAMLMSPDLDRYRPARPPPIFRIWSLVRHAPRILWNMRAAFFVLLRPAFSREKFDAGYQPALDAFDTWVRGPIDLGQSLSDCLFESVTRAGPATMNASYPAFVNVYLQTERIKGLVDKSSRQQVAMADAVCGGYEKDMVVQMGILLFDLANAIPRAAFEDLASLERDIVERRMPDAVLALWDEFIHTYGARGPLEMEISLPKYGDDVALVLQQLASIAVAGGSFNPREMHQQRIRERESAFLELKTILTPRKARVLEKAYATCLAYSDAREYFKHHILQCYGRVRALLLHRAGEFVSAGRLDRVEQIFDMTMDDVDRAVRDDQVDVRALALERGAFSRKLKAHVRHFPLAIDSRGRIMRPEPVIEDGALVGSAVSPGSARGAIKVMSDPFEKELLPGEVLVAVTTDPGWTPLFINASAVILEIGGPLQHGALVAREYGKPCVSGIPNVTAQFEDGQIVEVDGTNGVIRFLEPGSLATG